MTDSPPSFCKEKENILVINHDTNLSNVDLNNLKKSESVKIKDINYDIYEIKNNDYQKIVEKLKTTDYNIMDCNDFIKGTSENPTEGVLIPPPVVGLTEHPDLNISEVPLPPPPQEGSGKKYRRKKKPDNNKMKKIERGKFVKNTNKLF